MAFDVMDIDLSQLFKMMIHIQSLDISVIMYGIVLIGCS